MKERYALTSQIRRAAVSIPSNISEGDGRKITADYLRALYIGEEPEINMSDRRGEMFLFAIFQ